MQKQEKSEKNLELLCSGLTQVVRQDGRVIFSGDSIFDSKYCLIGRVSTDVRMMKICNMLCNVQCLLAAIQMTLLRQLACVSKKLNEYVMGDEVWGAVLKKFHDWSKRPGSTSGRQWLPRAVIESGHCIPGFNTKRGRSFLCSAAFVVDTAFPRTCSKDTRLVINLDEDEIMPAVTKMAMNFLDACIQMDSGSKYLYLLLLVCDHDFAAAGPLSWGL